MQFLQRGLLPRDLSWFPLKELLDFSTSQAQHRGIIVTHSNCESHGHSYRCHSRACIYVCMRMLRGVIHKR